jgi:RNA polymerase sigma-70 factor (ECF subfamily)
LDIWRDRWRIVEGALDAGPFLLGERFCATDLYLAALSRWDLPSAWRAANLPKVERLAAEVAQRPALREVGAPLSHALSSVPQISGRRAMVAPVDRREYEELARACRRRTARRAGLEPEDLLHDVIVALLQRGVDEPSSAYLRGAVRRRAAFVSRSEGRRRSRERAYETQRHGATEHEAWSWAPEILRELPPSLRQVAVLLSADLQRSEIAAVLGISDTALRQRLSALRVRLRARPGARVGARVAVRDLPTGLLRRALVRLRQRTPGFLLGTHDPDGHLIAFSVAGCSRTASERQQGGRSGDRTPPEEQ